MKAYKYEIVILDFENFGQEEITGLLKSAMGITPIIISSNVADIGDWSDDHPGNKKNTYQEYYKKVFQGAKE
jgi:hypothetical protein